MHLPLDRPPTLCPQHTHAPPASLGTSTLTAALLSPSSVPASTSTPTQTPHLPPPPRLHCWPPPHRGTPPLQTHSLPPQFPARPSGTAGCSPLNCPELRAPERLPQWKDPAWHWGSAPGRRVLHRGRGTVTQEPEAPVPRPAHHPPAQGRL